MGHAPLEADHLDEDLLVVPLEGAQADDHLVVLVKEHTDLALERIYLELTRCEGNGDRVCGRGSKQKVWICCWGRDHRADGGRGVRVVVMVMVV